MNEIDPEILKDFVGEALGNLDDAAASLIKLEQQPDDIPQADAALRVFHSVKGASGFFDLHSVKTVAHRMETVLVEIRSLKLRPTSEITSTLLHGVDLLKSLLAAAVGQALPDVAEQKKAYLATLEEILLATSDATTGGLATPAPGRTSGETGPLKKTMRVDESTVDGFMTYTGELISASEVFYYLQGKLNRENIDNQLKTEFKNAILSFHALSQNLQKSLMEIRKLPLKNLFSKYPRLIRDLGVTLGRETSLVITGDELHIDKSLVEILDDPLVHILRNSMDHGFESPEERVRAGKPRAGTLSIVATTDDTHLSIRIEDDGKGIDPAMIREAALRKGFITPEQARTLSDTDAINLIYAPGFSSSDEVTDVSGRGVGMDVVLTNVKKANGAVTVTSQPGKGTAVHIRLPLTVTTLILKGLIVKAKDEHLVVPLDSVKAVEGVLASKIFRLQGHGEAVLFRGQTLPVFALSRVLGWEDPNAKRDPDSTVILVVVEHDQHLLGLLIDGLLGVQQVAVKEVGSMFAKNPFLSGGSILRDGRVGLLLNVKTLATVGASPAPGPQSESPRV